MTEPVHPTAGATPEPWHLSAELLRRYAGSAPGALSPAQAVSVEAHLDACSGCRRRLPLPADEVLRTIEAALRQQVARTPQYLRSRRLGVRLTAGLPLSWLLAALGACLLATVLDVVSQVADRGLPSALLLLAPVLPLVAVAAAWTPSLDPLHELTAGTPGAGLALLLRRTLVVLSAVLPLTLALGLLTGGGASSGLWLLPCLALTALALALGTVVGVHRAAGGLIALWLLAVVAPALAQRELPLLLEPSSAAGWLAALVVAAAVLAVRRAGYRHAAPSL